MRPAEGLAASGGARRRRVGPWAPILLTLAGLTLAACAPAPRPAPSAPPPPPAQPVAQAPAQPAQNAPLSGAFGSTGMSPDGMVRVAFLAPLSGQAAPTGQALLNAAQMAAFDLGGDRFVLQPYDTGGTPQGAMGAARQALSQGARLILGPLYANSTRSVGSMAAGAGVNVVSFSTDPSVAGGNVFVMGYLLREQVARVVTFAMSEGRRRFGVLAPGGAYGQIAAQALRQEVRARGGDVVAVQTYSAGSPDLRGPARAMSGAEAVLIPDSGDGLRAAANGLAYVNEDSRSTRVLGTMLWDDPGLWRESALSGGIFPAPPRASVRKFESRYQSAFGSKPPDLAVLGYDAVALAARAVAVRRRAALRPRHPDQRVRLQRRRRHLPVPARRHRATRLTVMEIRPGGNVVELSPRRNRSRAPARPGSSVRRPSSPPEVLRHVRVRRRRRRRAARGRGGRA